MKLRRLNGVKQNDGIDIPRFAELISKLKEY